MPGKTSDASLKEDVNICKRCTENNATIVVRHEALCNGCFMKYVSTKIVKRMEGFRVRNAAPEHPRVLLLAMSLGVSSLVLLHVLTQHLQRQLERTGRPGYKLHVVHVMGEESSSTSMQDLKGIYPGHSYYTIENLEQDPAEMESNRGINDENADGQPATSNMLVSNEDLLASVPSPTARADMYNILRTRAIIQKAKSLGCEGVLWGHSTTKLAESIMAETAKGRGFALPWLANDGETPDGLLSMHPVKDLLRKELLSYWEIISQSQGDLPVPVENLKLSISTKNTAIDQLMTTYFESVENNYPSIVANVLRTSSKLNRSSQDVPSIVCALCKTPVPQDGVSGLYAWGQDPCDVTGHGDRNGKNLCYGCARSTHKSKLPT